MVRAEVLAVRDLRIAFPGVGEIVSLPEWTLGAGGCVALAGPSGAGKTSLLHALAGIERPAGGSVTWGGVPIWSLSGRARDRWRRRSLGLVFQDIHLVDGLSALDNVLLPLLFERVRVDAGSRARACARLAAVGIADPARPVGVMSRGERQRVALARALLHRPAILIADEPTASLDRASAAAVADQLVAAAAETGATLLVSSHDPLLLARVPAQLRLESGRVLAP